MFNAVGLVGLGPMGCAMAQNLCDHGIGVKAWDRDPDALRRASRILASDVPATSLDDVVEQLSSPRCFLLFLPDGQPVEETLDGLKKRLGSGDIVVDCGNSHYRDTERRQRMLEENGINLIGVGISGGPKGARSGPAIMAGGDLGSWKKTRSVFDAVAAKSGESPCSGYFGKDGAGHFVKMVHNGIEYAVMHLLAELHGFLSSGFGMDEAAVVSVFTNLNRGLTTGYLIKIMPEVLKARTQSGDQPLIDIVDDAVEQKGTGKWTVEAALEFGAAIPTIAEAVLVRSLSSNRNLKQETLGNEKNQRVSARPQSREFDVGDAERLELALALAMASAFAQGMTLFSSAGEAFGNPMDRAAILRTWRQGCILRGALVQSLIQAVEESPGRQNLLLSGTFPDMVRNGLPALRSLVAEAVEAGIPMSGFASALAYVELLNGGIWPGRVIQLQRDFFGSHGLKNKETGVVFHGPWHEGE